MYFSYFVIFSPWKRVWPFIWTNFNSLYEGCFLPSLVHQFLYSISILSSLEKGVALYLSKLESPSPKDAVCHAWLELVWEFWRRLKNFVNVFLLFHNCLIYLEKGMAIQLNIIESPFIQRCLVPSWLKLGKWFLRRCEKLTDGQTDERQQAITKSLSEPSAQVS